MATIVNSTAPSSQVAAVSPSAAGIYHIPQITSESAQSASDLLQKNHITYHIFLNDIGYHNHIAHHLLTLFALGASPEQLKTGYDVNKGSQRPQAPLHSDVLQQMTQSRSKVAELYGQGQKHYHDFQEFFAGEIERRGVKGMLNEWLFKGDDVAEGILTRMFAGFFHPFIHFGFGLEFHQPAILAEAFAQAAAHDNWVERYLLACEKKAASSSSTITTTNKSSPHPSPSLLTLLHEASSNHAIQNSTRPTDENKTRDGTLVRSFDEMVSVASKWVVLPTVDDLKFRVAEMMQTDIYFTAGAQRADKIPKIDFFYLHCCTPGLFFSSFLEDKENQALFLETEADRKNLVRLLEMKGRFDLAMYVSRGCPKLDMDRIKGYVPKHPEQGWQGIFARACVVEDDGHASKLIRTVANAERVCRDYEVEQDWPVKGDMWLKIGHLVIDSVEADGPRWVRGAGFDEEWKDIPNRMDAKL